MDQQLGLGWVVDEEVALGDGWLMGGVVAGRPGPGGCGVGQGEGVPPLSLAPRLLRRLSSRGGRMLMERSQAVAR